MKQRRLIQAAAFALFLATCSLPWVGLWNPNGVADTGLYSLYGHLLERAPLLNAVLPFGLPDNDLTAQLTGELRASNTRDVLLKLLLQAMHEPKKRRKTKPVVVPGNPAIDAPILVCYYRTKIIKHVNIVEMVEVRMTLFLVIQIHEYVIRSVNVVGPCSKSLRNFDHRVFGKSSFLQNKGVFRGELCGDIRFQVHRGIPQQVARFIVGWDVANALPEDVFKSS